MDKKALRTFKRLVEPYGVSVEGKGGHYAVIHQNKRVATLSHTGNINAMREGIACLARQGIVPDSLRRERFS